MKHFILSIAILTGLPNLVSAQKEIRFNTIDSLFSYADQSSTVIKNNDEQSLLAKFQKLAAQGNVVNFQDPITYTMNDNTLLPKSFIPGGGPFGGTPGTFIPITLGQQYVSNLTYTPQIDIINPANWAQINRAGVSQELTTTTNLLNIKSLYESIAACYYNIASYQEQIKIVQKNTLSADSILQVVKNKYAEGLVRQQDVNDATVTELNLQNNLKQLQINLEQQYYSLKLLCDTPPDVTLVVDDELNTEQTFNAELTAGSNLLSKSYILQAESAKANLTYNRMLNLPVLSVLYSHSLYQNSKNQFFDNEHSASWYNSAFIGARVTFNLPNINQLVLARNAKINYDIALINMAHNQLQNDINNKQLELDYQKNFSQYTVTRRIASLKEDNYKMAFNQYSESILSFDKLLASFNDMLVSRVNYKSALANLLYTKTKIDINNKIK